MKPFPKPTKIASYKNLRSVWNESGDARGKGKAAGIDNVSPERFRENLELNLKKIQTSLLNNAYNFKPLKPFKIPKSKNRSRIICVPCVSDRLVQRLMLKHLASSGDRLEVKNSVSFGVLKGKEQGVHSAINAAVKLRHKFPWLLKTDIMSFFDQIDRQDLIAIIHRKLGRHSLVPLLEQVIHCEMSSKDPHVKQIARENGVTKGKGLRQGMPLSPLLSNVVLGRFDSKAQKMGLNIIRYVDDLIVFSASEKECLEHEKFIKEELEKVRLSIPSLNAVDSKTEVKSPDDSVIFLGMEIYRCKNGEYARRVPQIFINETLEEIGKYKNYEFALGKRLNFASTMNKLQLMPRGYQSAFKESANLDAFVVQVRNKTDEVREKLLENLLGREVVRSLSKQKRIFLGLY